MYTLKKDLPNIKAGSEVDNKNKIVVEILKDEKLKKEWLEEAKTEEDINNEWLIMLENRKSFLEMELEEINSQLKDL